MTASKNSTSASRADIFAGPAADSAARQMQQMLETWLGAWRGLVDPAWAASPDATNRLAAFQLPQFPQSLPFQVPSLGEFAGASPFAELKLPAVPIPPEQLQRLQADYSRECIALMRQAINAKQEAPELKDKRFSADAWKASPAHAFVAAWYLLNARYLHELADAIDADPKTRERIRFTVQQWTAAVAPSNFLALNPDAQKAVLETRGESLRQGMMNLLDDLQRGKILQSDESQFVVGKNLACTEGSVVYENDLIQLIQYKPTTETVFERPLLIVPPCINKFYILDLQPENSLVAHALSCGHQVFLVSWRNADASIAGKTWDDYMDEGLFAAIDVVQQISGQDQINTLGFCIGGTMLATALSVLADRGEHPAASMTLLTSMLDFSDTGLLDVFVDEAHVQMREQTIGGKNGAPPGLMRGIEFVNTFSFLRPNDLVWNYVVDSYLKGRTPPPFDLLYWNSDSTNLPGPMYCWGLRNTYFANKLRESGALTVCGSPVDLSRIDLPTFLYASREDHIVLWRTAYASTSILKGALRFVLGASGHVAGVINPPAKKKRSHWTYDPPDGQFPARPDDWFAAATEHPGSWWTEWTGWLDQFGGKRVKPPAHAGSDQFQVIEPAPGRYVLQRD